jgi:hypothetical protein
MADPRQRRTSRSAALAVVLVATCARAPDPMRYRLSDSGSHWDVSGADRVFDDVSPRYPEFFARVLDPASIQDLDLRELRDDLERRPADRRNYDALNAVAIAYFELNYRAQALRGSPRYLTHSFQAAKLLAIPWRAYGEIQEHALREAILDFFEDAARGGKLEAATTAGRLGPIVRSLERKEADPKRLARIRALAARIEAAHGSPP